MILPPDCHDQIWAIQEPLNFPKQVFGVDRSPGIMTEIMAGYTRGLRNHVEDRVIEN